MKIAERQIVLGVDLDGVCADFYGRMREIAAEWFERDVGDLTTDVSYSLKEWGIATEDQYQSLHRFAVTQRDLFKTSKMIPGARRYLRRLSDEGFRIRIITYRLFIHHFHAAAVQQTIEWLDQNGIPYWDLCFMKQKDQVGADIYIDDNPAIVEELRAANLCIICFGNSTNKGVDPPRATGWQQVYELVHRFEQGLCRAPRGAPHHGKDGSWTDRKET